MTSNLDRYKTDLAKLIKKGDKLHNAIQFECSPEDFTRAAKVELGAETKAFISRLPSFKDTYQGWYSEAVLVITQLLPDRLEDFTRLYEKPKTRKQITYESYTIEDCLHGLTVKTAWERVVGPDAAIPRFRQQLSILRSVEARFESSLFDIQTLVQADLFDSELEASRELAKKKFTRAAGALAGVVLERHLSRVAKSHKVSVSKKAPTISDWNEALKAATVTDIPQWRFIQHLGDIRNLCDHSKHQEPSIDQVNDLITGVAKLIKTLF